MISFRVVGNHDFSGQLSLLYPPSAIQQYFPCKKCGKVFTTPGSLRNHNKIHTGDTSCSICHRQLATVSSLNRHIRKEHWLCSRLEMKYKDTWTIKPCLTRLIRYTFQVFCLMIYRQNMFVIFVRKLFTTRSRFQVTGSFILATRPVDTATTSFPQSGL